MPNETEANVTPVKSGKTSVLLVLMASLVLLAVGSMGFYQLWQANVMLTRQVVNLGTETANSQTKLTNLTKSLEQLSQAAVQQDRATTDVYKQLVDVDDQIDQLPLLIAEHQVVPAANPPSTSTEAAPSSWWRLLFLRLVDALNRIVVVRHIGINAQPVVAPDEKLFLYQNLHAELSSAIWGALHHNSVVYQTSLKRALNRVTQYYIQDAPQTKNILAALTLLQGNDVAAVMP